MTLIDSLPKKEDKILLNPAGRSDGELVGGLVEKSWFKENFNELSKSIVPLTDENYKELKGIGEYWHINAEQWRIDGII